MGKLTDTVSGWVKEQNVASAKGFMQHIKKLGKDFAIGRQEDSHEFLVQLLEAVETIMLRERGDWADLDARSKVNVLPDFLGGEFRQVEGPLQASQGRVASRQSPQRNFAASFVVQFHTGRCETRLFLFSFIIIYIY